MKTTGLNTYTDALVTDQKQQRVTDQSVKNELARLGVAEDRAVFKYDYSREFPVSKMYQVNDPESPHHGAHIVAISNLPMVNARGEKCIPGWRNNGDGTYSAGPNQFEADVATSGAVAITPFNNQPNGAKAGETTSWKPRLIFNGHEVMAVSGPVLLDVDPVNSNYRRNVLEWDYGICKRRLRLIEGRLLERWVFDRNPGATVRIEHGFAGPKLRLGPYAVDEDTEQVTAEQFAQAQYPFSISATGTFYPDASPESTSVDGYVNSEGDASWATHRGASSGGAHDSVADDPNFFIATTATSGNWSVIKREIFLFDTSGLHDSAVITSAVFSVRSWDKYDYLSCTPGCCLVASTPASNTELVNGDFDQLGATEFATRISYASWNTAGYNDFTLNASGLAAVTKTGITKLGLRISHDFDNSEPSWVSESPSGFRIYYSEQGTGYKPKLVVTYTPATASGTTDAATSVGETIATLNGTVTDTGGEDPTRYFQYGKSGSYELGDINKGAGGVGAFSHGLSGLDSGTLYYFRVKLVNGGGTTYGSQRTFTTLAPPGWTGKIGGVVNPEKFGGVSRADIKKIGGV
jgi:hypothetical protein